MIKVSRLTFLESWVEMIQKENSVPEYVIPWFNKLIYQ